LIVKPGTISPGCYAEANVASIWADITAWATFGRVGMACAVFALSIAASLVVSAIVALRLPVDYFTSDKLPLPLAGHAPWLRICARIGLNLLGVALIILGLLMSLPGVPGQGLLTVLLGLMLTELPGKRRLERALVRRKLINRAINSVRLRFSKPPIEIPAAAS
jgi:hypothetical protein